MLEPNEGRGNGRWGEKGRRWKRLQGRDGAGRGVEGVREGGREAKGAVHASPPMVTA